MKKWLFVALLIGAPATPVFARADDFGRLLSVSDAVAVVHIEAGAEKDTFDQSYPLRYRAHIERVLEFKRTLSLRVLQKDAPLTLAQGHLYFRSSYIRYQLFEPGRSLVFLKSYGTAWTVVSSMPVRDGYVDRVVPLDRVLTEIEREVCKQTKTAFFDPGPLLQRQAPLERNARFVLWDAQIGVFDR